MNGLASVRRDGARAIRRFDQESEQIRPLSRVLFFFFFFFFFSLSTVLVSGDDDRGRFTRVRSSVPTTRIAVRIPVLDREEDVVVVALETTTILTTTTTTLSVVVVRGGGGGLLRALLRRHRFRRSQLQRHFPRALHRLGISFEDIFLSSSQRQKLLHFNAYRVEEDRILYFGTYTTRKRRRRREGTRLGSILCAVAYVFQRVIRVKCV